MTQETTEFEFHMSPGAELVAAPDRRRHFTEEIEQALRTGGVGGQPTRAVDGLRDVGDAPSRQQRT